MIGVNKYYQRQGYGRSMIKYLISQFEKILVYLDNDEVIGFYDKLNFKYFDK